MLKSIILSALRWGVTGLAAYLLHKGVVDADEQQQMISVAVAVATLLWGIGAHMRSEGTISYQLDHIQLLEQAVPTDTGLADTVGLR